MVYKSLVHSIKDTMTNEIFGFGKKKAAAKFDGPRWPSSHEANSWMDKKVAHEIKHNPEHAHHLFSPASAGSYLPVHVHVGSSWKPEHEKHYEELKKKHPDLVERAKKHTKSFAGQISLSRIGPNSDFHGMSIREETIAEDFPPGGGDPAAGGDPNDPAADAPKKTAKDKRSKVTDAGDEPIKKGSKSEVILEPVTDDVTSKDTDTTTKPSKGKKAVAESYYADKQKKKRQEMSADDHLKHAVEHQKQAHAHNMHKVNPPENMTIKQKADHIRTHETQAQWHERGVAHHIHHFLQKDHSVEGAKRLQSALHKSGSAHAKPKKKSWKFWENEDFNDMTLEQLDEVSSATLGRYKDASNKEASTINSMTSKMDNSPIRKKLMDRLKKRNDGAVTAAKKQTNSRDVAVHASNQNSIKSSYSKRNHNESVEQIDEAKMGAEFKKQLDKGNKYLSDRHDQIIKRHHMGQSDAEIARRMKLHPAVVSASTGILRKESVNEEHHVADKHRPDHPDFGGDVYERHVHNKGEKNEHHAIIKTMQNGHSTMNQWGGYSSHHVGTPKYIDKKWKQLKAETNDHNNRNHFKHHLKMEGVEMTTQQLDEADVLNHNNTKIGTVKKSGKLHIATHNDGKTFSGHTRGIATGLMKNHEATKHMGETHKEETQNEAVKSQYSPAWPKEVHQLRKQLSGANTTKHYDEISRKLHAAEQAHMAKDKTIKKEETVMTSSLQRIKSILEARHSKGGGTKRQGLESDSDDHIINQLRKATNLRDHKITFKDKSKHHVAPHIAKTALEKYTGLRTSQEKDAISKAYHASHESFKNAMAGHIAPKKSHKITLPTSPFNWRK